MEHEVEQSEAMERLKMRFPGPNQGCATSPPSTARQEGDRDKGRREEEGGEAGPDQATAVKRAKVSLTEHNMPRHAFSWLPHGPSCLPRLNVIP